MDYCLLRYLRAFLPSKQASLTWMMIHHWLRVFTFRTSSSRSWMRWSDQGANGFTVPFSIKASLAMLACARYIRTFSGQPNHQAYDDDKSSSPDEILTLSYTLFIEVKNESLGRDSLPRDSFLLQWKEYMRVSEFHRDWSYCTMFYS